MSSPSSASPSTSTSCAGARRHTDRDLGRHLIVETKSHDARPGPLDRALWRAGARPMPDQQVRHRRRLGPPRPHRQPLAARAAPLRPAGSTPADPPQEDLHDRPTPHPRRRRLALSAAACSSHRRHAHATAVPDPTTVVETSDPNPNYPDKGRDRRCSRRRRGVRRHVVHEIAIAFDEADYDAMIADVHRDRREEVDRGDRHHRRRDLRTGRHAAQGQLVARRARRRVRWRPPGRRRRGRRPRRRRTTSRSAGRRRTAAASDRRSADEPEDLPWLIRLDEFVEGQDHQGYEDIVVRSNGSETVAQRGGRARPARGGRSAPRRRPSPTRFSVNGGDAVLRLVIEHPDDDAWQEASFDGDGALYKAESTGDWSYRGDDPAPTRRSSTRRAAATSPT